MSLTHKKRMLLRPSRSARARALTSRNRTWPLAFGVRRWLCCGLFVVVPVAMMPSWTGEVATLLISRPSSCYMPANGTERWGSGTCYIGAERTGPRAKSQRHTHQCTAMKITFGSARAADTTWRMHMM